MAKTTMAAGRGSGGVAFNGTLYGAVSGFLSQAAEANVRSPFVSSTGTFSNLRANIRTNTCNGTGYVRLRVSGANGNLVASVTAATTGFFEDNANTDTISAGNTVNYSYSGGGSSGTMVPNSIAVTFAASSNTVMSYAALASSFSQATANTYAPINGNASTSVTIAQKEIKLTAGTLQNLQATVSANAGTATTVLKMSVNGTDANITISVPAATTGVYTDVTNTDAVTLGDRVVWHISATAGTGTITFVSTIVEFVSTNSTQTLAEVTAQSIATGATNHWAPDATNSVSATLIDGQIKVPYGATLGNLSAYVVGNTSTTAATFVAQVNNTESAVIVSITALTTGWFTDDVNTVDISADDLVTLKGYGTTVGSVSISARGVSMKEISAITSDIKSINGLVYASIKSWNGLAMSSVKNLNGLA